MQESSPQDESFLDDVWEAEVKHSAMINRKRASSKMFDSDKENPPKKQSTKKKREMKGQGMLPFAPSGLKKMKKDEDEYGYHLSKVSVQTISK